MNKIHTSDDANSRPETVPPWELSVDDVVAIGLFFGFLIGLMLIDFDGLRELVDPSPRAPVVVHTVSPW